MCTWVRRIGFDFALGMFGAATSVAISAVMELSRQAHRYANTCGFTQIDIYQYDKAVLHTHTHKHWERVNLRLVEIRQRI